MAEQVQNLKKINIIDTSSKGVLIYVIYIYIYIYVYIYRRYHTITDVYTTALLLTNPSSNDDSGIRHGFRAEASLPLAQSAPAVSHDTTRLCQIVVALWDCQIPADAVRALSWIFTMYFLLYADSQTLLLSKIYIYIYIYIVSI